MYTKMVIVFRKDLNLTPGKMAAQAVHAALRGSKGISYANAPPVCIICIVKTIKQLEALYTKVKFSGLPYGLQIDAGYNEVAAHTTTALCIGPTDNKNDFELLNKLTKRLRLFT